MRSACEYCGATYHRPYDDGLVECRNRLVEQRDDAERETAERIVAMLRRRAERHRASPVDVAGCVRLLADEIERGDYRDAK